ncbi:rhomboid family protein [Russula earlei]|uniref:Rhomboid family protein n=1 Tax=Russula earlei TaxID=71964 RepID=A0ACC0TRW3_9AGAM|nr:rhomboid family protein [Russula earlei]
MTQFRPNRFEILPQVIKNLLIINGLVFLAQYITEQQGGINMDNLFALHTWQSPLFKPWQLLTHMFLHGSIGHILSNMFVLWMFGSTLENLWGPRRFLIFYLICGLGAALCHMGVLEAQQVLEAKLNEPTLGASGAVFGCLAAFGYLFPNTQIYLYFLFPLKAKWFVLIYAGFELTMAISNSAGDNVAHVAHLGGALVGFLLVYFWNRNNRRTFY